MSKYLVIDTETTGLDPDFNGIITCSAVVYDEMKPIVGWNGYNIGWKMFEISAGALKVNGFKLNDKNSPFSFLYRKLNTKIKYVNFDTEEDFTRSLVDFLVKEAPLCDYVMGMNLQFDLSFLKSTLRSLSINLDGILPRKQIDPRIVACALEDCKKLPEAVKKVNSESLYEGYGIKTPQAISLHRSDTDVFMTHRLWMEMKKYFL